MGNGQPLNLKKLTSVVKGMSLRLLQMFRDFLVAILILMTCDPCSSQSSMQLIFTKQCSYKLKIFHPKFIKQRLCE